MAQGESDGFIKIVVSKENMNILYAGILGYCADELIHEFVLAKKNGLSVKDIAGTVHAHPTFSETIQDAARAVFDKPIHG